MNIIKSYFYLVKAALRQTTHLERIYRHTVRSGMILIFKGTKLSATGIADY